MFDVLFAMKFIFWCFWIYVIWDHFKVEQPSELAQWILSHVKNHKLHIKVQTANRLARSCKNLVATVYAKAKVYALHLKPLNLAFVILSFFSLHLLSYLKPFSLQGTLSFCWLKYFCQQIHPNVCMCFRTISCSLKIDVYYFLYFTQLRCNGTKFFCYVRDNNLMYQAFSSLDLVFFGLSNVFQTIL